MVECPKLSGCPFFTNKLAHMPATAEMAKKDYCLGEYATCARFMVATALSSPSVPEDLYPNQTERAQQIIETSARSSSSR